MSDKRFLIWVAVIPAIIVLGHDIYLFMAHTGIENIAQILDDKTRPWHSYFATAGYIWTTYSPASYKWIAQNLTSDQWDIVNMVLGYKAILVSLGIGGFIALAVGFLKALPIWPNARKRYRR